MTITEFKELTPREIYIFIDAALDTEKSSFKERAILLDGLATQLISGTRLMNPEIIPLTKLYPKLFEIKVSEEQKNKITAETWLGFLLD